MQLVESDVLSSWWEVTHPRFRHLTWICSKNSPRSPQSQGILLLHPAVLWKTDEPDFNKSVCHNQSFPSTRSHSFRTTAGQRHSWGSKAWRTKSASLNIAGMKILLPSAPILFQAGFSNPLQLLPLPFHPYACYSQRCTHTYPTTPPNNRKETFLSTYAVSWDMRNTFPVIIERDSYCSNSSRLDFSAY